MASTTIRGVADRQQQLAQTFGEYVRRWQIEVRIAAEARWLRASAPDAAHVATQAYIDAIGETDRAWEEFEQTVRQGA